MTARLESRQSRPRPGVFAKLRRLLTIVRTVDVEQLFRQLDARQRRLEQAQQNLETVMAQAAARMEAVLQRPDMTTSTVSILDIKNLGYELGRQLAERNFRDRSPTLDHTRLRSKLCTQDDFTADWMVYWCRELGTAPIYHRKIWELCYVAQTLFSEGLLEEGRRGLAFGCGEEPLPSLFAKYGALIMATDLDPSRPEAEVWRVTAQHAATIDAIRRRDICPDERLLANIDYRPVDMNAIPRDFDGQFDFCWSTCALEHLGTLENGLSFIENSVRTLKPGGLAVHTTEFTVNDGPTIDNHPIVLYQRRHFEELTARLTAAGHEVVPFDFSPGDGILDRFVDLPPYRDNGLIPAQHHAHLKLLYDGYTCTSIGIIVRAGGSSSL